MYRVSNEIVSTQTKFFIITILAFIFHWNSFHKNYVCCSHFRGLLLESTVYSIANIKPTFLSHQHHINVTQLQYHHISQIIFTTEITLVMVTPNTLCIPVSWDNTSAICKIIFPMFSAEKLWNLVCGVWETVLMDIFNAYPFILH